MDELRNLKPLSLAQIRERYSNDYILRHFSISRQEEQWLPNKFFCIIANKQPATIYAAKKNRSSKYKIMTIGGELWVSVTHYFDQAKISVPRGGRRTHTSNLFPRKQKNQSTGEPIDIVAYFKSEIARGKANKNKNSLCLHATQAYSHSPQGAIHE